MSSFRLIDRRQIGPVPSFYDFQNVPIGKGSFGQVYKSTHKITNKVYAIKQISKIDPKRSCYKDNHQLQQINHQLIIMYQLDCEYIAKVFDHFQDHHSIYLVLEFVQGVELYKGIIHKRIRLENQQIAKIIYQLCLALKYLHEKNIIHRDIKPQNIIFTKTKDIKLIDFGTSNFVGPDDVRKTKTGSIPYFAPEIVKSDTHGEAVDLWCVGILLYEMFVLKTPFGENQETQKNILKNKIIFPSIMDLDMKDLIQKILVRDPNRRLRIDQIIKHPWITKTLFGVPPSPSIRPKSRSVEKREIQKSSVQKKSISKQLTPRSNNSQSKSLSKRVKSANENLQQKIIRLQKQIAEGETQYKQQQHKKRVLLEKKITEITEKTQKLSRQTTKYDSIIKINLKKVNQINNQIKNLEDLKKQNETILDFISQKKQQYSGHTQNKSQLRIQLANVEAKLRLNNNRKGSNRYSNSRSRSNDRPKVALSSRSINNFDVTTSSKFLQRENKLGDTVPVGQCSIAELQSYINNLSLKHNFMTQ